MNRTHLLRVAAVLLAAGLMSGQFSMNGPAALAGEPWDAAEMDWPYWRGPEMNGTSREKNIPAEWSPDKVGENNLIWKNEEAAGRSTPIVMDGLLYTTVRDNPGTKMEGEKVLCLDAATGKKVWENSFGVYLSDVPDTRVGWSSVVGDPETNKIFVHGVCGYFACIDAKTGKTEWSRSLHEEFGALSTYGGRTNFPITYKNLVITSAVVIGWGEMAKPAHRFMAFDQRNGELVWFEGTRLLPEDTTWSGPVLTAFNGEAALVFGSGDGGVHAFQPETGKSIWFYDASARGLNAMPIVIGNKVVCGHNQENLDSTKMGALFCLDGTKRGKITEPEWRNVEMYVGKGAPVHVDGKIFVIDDPSSTGTLLCVDLETGKLLKEQRLGGPSNGSPLYVDGKVYVMTTNGRWWVFEPNQDGFKVLARERLRIGDVNGSPIVSHGRMYIPAGDALYCIGNADAEPSAGKRPQPPAIDPPTADQTPAQVQITPVETLLKPGERQELQVRLYNKKGQYLGLAKDAQFEVQGVGSVKDGAYFAPAKKVTDAAQITAKVDGISGSARVRVVPPFPWNYDFDNGVIPVTWVGIRYRHVPIDFDLLQKLEQKNPEAKELYVYLWSNFINSAVAPGKTVKYDDSTARKTWTDFARFMNMLDIAGELEASKAKIDPLLEILKAERIISDWAWETWSDKIGDVTLRGVRLTLTRGPRQIDGNGVMMKISTIPKGTRSQGWMGVVDVSDYTVEADVYAAGNDRLLPDIGLEAQGYTLDLIGSAQQLQIRTWHAQLRMAETVPFEWQPGKWYRMKFRAAMEDGKAVLRGKVWERDQPEPKSWQVVAEDPRPNRKGSPGVFGNVTRAEAFYDNFKVYFNDSAAAK